MCFSFTKMKFIGFTLAPRNAPTQIRFLVNELAWRIQRRIYLAPLFAKLMLIISLTSIGYVPGVYGRSMLSLKKGIIVSSLIISKEFPKFLTTTSLLYQVLNHVMYVHLIGWSRCNSSTAHIWLDNDDFTN